MSLLPQQAHGPLRSFGRTKARTLKPRQAGLVDTLLPRLHLGLPVEGALDLTRLKPGATEVWLEIGFGGGEHMAAQAAGRPDVLVIGAEPFLNGVASALRHVHAQALENVRLHVGDVRDLLPVLPDASLDRLFILFPDPWPKLRHHKRRLVQPDFVDAAVRALKPGGRLRFATDWADYATAALDRFLRAAELRWTAERADDWRIAPADHVPTRYEQKRLGDVAPVFLDFIRT